MKVLVIQPKIGMGDMVIYLPYIHAISKKYKTAVSILVKENSRANQLFTEDRHIKEILILDRTKNNTGTHDGLLGFFKKIIEVCGRKTHFQLYIASSFFYQTRRATKNEIPNR